jgi:hypothetical protein
VLNSQGLFVSNSKVQRSFAVGVGDIHEARLGMTARGPEGRKKRSKIIKN